MPTILFFIAVICSMISQTPELIAMKADAYLKITWIFPLLYLVVVRFRSVISLKLAFYYFFVIIFGLYCCIMQLSTNIDYLTGEIGSDIVNIGISFMVTVVSFAYWENYGSPRKLRWLVVCLTVCGAYLAYAVYSQFLVKADISAIQYAFTEKNSMGQILVNVMVFGIACYIPKYTPSKVMYIIAFVFMLTVVFMMKSRATLVGVFFVIGYYILMYKNTKVRVLLFALSAAALVYLWVSPSAYETIVGNILLGGRDTTDLDDLSSGRIYLMSQQIAKIPDNLIFGSGVDYMDCFPVMVLVQYGLIGTFIMFLFLTEVAAKVSVKFKPRKGINLAAYLLFWIMMINSLFEAYPPFGPGVKCFILWMAFGFALAAYRRRQPAKQRPVSPSMADRRLRFRE